MDFPYRYIKTNSFYTSPLVNVLLNKIFFILDRQYVLIKAIRWKVGESGYLHRHKGVQCVCVCV